MDAKYTDEFFRDLYDAEIEHGHKLDAANSVFVVVLIALSTLLVYYSRLWASCPNTYVGIAFCILSAMIAGAYVVATVHTVLLFRPQEISLISSPKNWQPYVDGIQKHYAFQSTDSKDVEEQVAAEVSEQVRLQYIEAGEANRRRNMSKMFHHAWIKYSMGVAVLLMLCNGIPTYLVQQAKSDIQKVELVDPKPKDQENGSPGETTSGKSKADPGEATGKATAPEDRASSGRERNKPEEMKEGQMPDKPAQQPPQPATPAQPPAKPPAPGITKVKGGADLDVKSTTSKPPQSKE